MNLSVGLFVFWLSGTLAVSRDLETIDNLRDKKLFSLFSVVTFKNDGCSSSSSRNGTCYTSSECLSKGGLAKGNCAAG